MLLGGYRFGCLQYSFPEKFCPICSARDVKQNFLGNYSSEADGELNQEQGKGRNE